MTILAFEFNDAAITAVMAKALVGPAPGYAVSTDAGELFGREAWRQSRLRPRQTNNRYWRDLSTEPMATSLGRFTTSADLVHAHLGQIINGLEIAPSAVICAVPGHWSTVQLGLLLGIADELSLPVTGLVDSAVAATRREYRDQELLHVDAGLGQVVLTHLHQDGRVALGAGQSRQFVAEVGVESLERSIAAVIAARFLDATRFDPLHDARSEQYLYDHLYQWLAELQRQPEIAATIEFRGTDFSARISKQDIVNIVTAAFEPAVRRVRTMLVAGQSFAIQISHGLAVFPGVVESLTQLPQAAVYVLEPAAPAWGALQRAEQFQATSNGVGLMTALKWDYAPILNDGANSVAPPSQRASLPTHVLHDGCAYRLSSSPLTIGVELSAGEYGLRLNPSATGVSRRHCSIRLGNNGPELVDHSRFGTHLNGHTINAATILAAGDVIVIGRPGIELYLITEVTDTAIPHGT